MPKMLFMLAAHSVLKQSLVISIQKSCRCLTSMLGFHMWSWAALRWFQLSWGSSPVPAAWGGYIPPGTGSKPCGPECPAIYIMQKAHIKQNYILYVHSGVNSLVFIQSTCNPASCLLCPPHSISKNWVLVNLPIWIRQIEALYLVMVVLAHVLRTRVEPFTGAGTWITRSTGL